MERVLVTGTGTEVGKTIVAAAIANTAARAGLKVGVLKPVVTGLLDYPRAGQDLGWEMAAQLPDHELLRLAARSDQTDDEIAPYRFRPAASPHLAAALSRRRVEPERLRPAARAAAEGTNLFVCEGVGGLLVPLATDYTVRDFAKDMRLPVVIAARPGLGTINHTLLTIEAARNESLDVVAVVLTPWPERPSTLERSNLLTISRLGEVEVLTLPRLDLTSPADWPELEPGAPPPRRLV